MKTPQPASERQSTDARLSVTRRKHYIRFPHIGWIGKVGNALYGVSGAIGIWSLEDEVVACGDIGTPAHHVAALARVYGVEGVVVCPESPAIVVGARSSCFRHSGTSP